MNGVIDAVTKRICLFVTEGALKWPDGDSDKQVLLTVRHAETFNGSSGQIRMRSLGKDGDLLDDVGFVSKFISYTVTDVLR